MRVIPKQTKLDQIRNYTRDVKWNPSKVGEQTEQYVSALLEHEPLVKSVNEIGIQRDATDLVVRMDDALHGLQIKTIYLNNSKDPKAETYHLTLDKDFKYPDDMLVVMVNHERTRFAIDFFRNIKGKTGMSLTFNALRKRKRTVQLFTTESTFVKQLIAMIPQSAVFVPNVSGNVAKENAMMDRLQAFANTHHLTFEFGSTENAHIDGYLGGIPFQAKYVSKPSHGALTFGVSAAKSCGSVQGAPVTCPYAASDGFALFVIELGGKQSGDTLHHGQYCLIPCSELIHRGVLKTEAEPGRTSFSICPPDYAKDHWSKQYWNNLTVLSSLQHAD
jgi:hypothetical protein